MLITKKSRFLSVINNMTTRTSQNIFKKLTLVIFSALVIFLIAQNTGAQISNLPVPDTGFPSGGGSDSVGDIDINDVADIIINSGGDGGDSGSNGASGNSGEDSLEERVGKDKKTTDKEAEELAKLQKEDEIRCEAEAGGYSGGSSGTTGTGSGTGDGTTGEGDGAGDQGQPSDSDPVQNPDSDEQGGEGANGYGEPAGGEQETRDKLAAEGITVNKADCAGRDFRTVKGGCTSVGGLPQHSIDRSAEINREIGGGLVITSGTEAGHVEHKPGANVVDYSPDNAKLNEYIEKHTVSTTISKKTKFKTHYLDNGDVFTREKGAKYGDHWHAKLSGTVGGGKTALIDSPLDKLITYIDNFLSDNLSLHNLVHAEKTDPVRTVLLGTTPVDLDKATPTDLSEILLALDESQINDSFNRILSSPTESTINIRDIITKLPYDSLNHVLENLNISNLSEVIDELPSSNLGGIIGRLSYESNETILTQFSSSQLTSLLNDLNDTSLNNFINNTYNLEDFDDVIDNISSGSLDRIIGRLGDGAINGIFGNLSEGNLNSILGNLNMSSLNDIFSQLGGGQLNQVLSFLDGDVSETVFSLLGEGALGNILNNGLPEIVDSVLSDLPEDLLGDMVNGLSVDGLIDDFSGALDELPGVSDIINSIPGLEGILDEGGVVDTVVDTVTDTVTGGLYVPVVEQNGQLMSLTNSIERRTREIRELNVQICTHIRAVKRIQQRFEEKMVEDAAVRRAASTVIEQYKGALLGEEGLIKKGYQDSNGNSAPLYVVNEGVLIAQARDEAKRIVLDRIRNSKNMYKDEIADALQIDSVGRPFQPTLTEKEIKIISSAEENGFKASDQSEEIVAQEKNTSILATLRNIPFLGYLANPIDKLSSLFGIKTSYAEEEASDSEDYTDAEYWTALLKMFQPQNNRYGSYLIANDQLKRSQALAEANVRDEMIAGQGFLPVRKCNKWITDPEDSSIKTCIMWETQTPASIVKETAAQGMGTRLTQYETAKDMGDINVGNEPNVSELYNFTPTTDGGGAPGPGMVGPDGIPDQIEQASTYTPDTSEWGTEGGTGEGDDGDGTDGGEGGTEWSNFTGLLDLVIGESDSPSSDSLNLLELLIEFLANAYKNIKPLVYFADKDKGDGQYLLYWASPNATDCKAGNDWANGEEIIKKKGDSLTKRANLLVTASTTAREYKLDCTNDKGTTQKTMSI